MNRLTIRSRKKSKDALRQMKMKTQLKISNSPAKAALAGKFIKLLAHLKKQGKSQIKKSDFATNRTRKITTKPKVNRGKKL